MKSQSVFRCLIAILTFALGISAVQAAPLTEVTVIPQAKTQAALDNKANLRLLIADDVWVEGAYRNKAGSPELHTDNANVFYITAGSTTIVAGGTYVGGSPTGPGEVRGGTIDGKGDATNWTASRLRAFRPAGIEQKKHGYARA